VKKVVGEMVGTPRERRDGAGGREEIKRMARERPNVPLSCPACGQTVKGKNLVRHWDGAHDVGLNVGSLQRAEGEDPRAKVLWLIVAASVIPLAIGLDELLGIGREGVLAGVVLSALGFCLVLAAVLVDGLSRAQLRVSGHGLRLRRRLWFGSRLELPLVRLVAGVANASVGGSSMATNDDVVPTYREWNEGLYLDLRFTRGRVLVHCPALGLSKFTQRWALPQGALGSPRKRYWAHIRLTRPDFERLEAWLAEQGALQRRS
jgi:hypothetical protein